MKVLRSWLPTLPKPVRLGVISGAGLAVLVLGLAAVAAGLNGALLRTYADVAPDHPVLAAYAGARAAPVYQSRCASCHGGRMQGDRLRGAPRLDDHDWLYGEGKVAQIEQVIRHGVRSGDARGRDFADMPAYGQARPYARQALPPLTPGQIRDVVEFLRDHQALDHDPAAAARGELVWRRDGGCYDCHGEDAGGDGSVGAPNLNDHVWLQGDGSRRAVFDQIAHGAAGTCPGWFERLSPGEIRALAVYIHDRAETLR